jgi:hypothetical protein
MTQEPAEGDGGLVPDERVGRNVSIDPASQQTNLRRQRVLRIRITDVESGRLKVGLSIPANLVSVALRQGARLLPQGHGDLDLVAAIANNDSQFPWLIEDEQNGERVEIGLE